MQDLFEKIRVNKGPLGKWAPVAEGYYVFPKLSSETISEKNNEST